MGTTSIKFSMDQALGLNKVKELTKNEKGYYRVILSVLDVPNSVGLIYDSKAFINVIQNSPVFRRAITDGQLYGENGHPTPFGMDRTEFFRRCCTIVEARHSFHISEVWPESFVDQHTGLTRLGVWGWVKPAGELGYVLQQALDNPEENVAFSLRGVAPINPATGRKELRSLTTWDKVGIPGLRGSSIINARTAKASMEAMDFVIEISDEEMDECMASLESDSERAAMEEVRSHFRQELVSKKLNVSKPSWL